MTRPGALALALLALFVGRGAGAAPYFGQEVGALSELQHGVRGRLFAVDSRTLFLHDFHYDGEGPAAYFYVGTTKTVGRAGALRLRDERGGAGPLRRYRAAGLALALPEGKTLRDFTWFAVWCDEFEVNFGDVALPRALEPPRAVRLGALRGVHGVRSDPVVAVDAQTLLVPNFSYDGEAPDAKFWVGRGDTPSAQGIRIPDEHGSEEPLRKYDRKTVVLTLPGELTVFDVGHLAVWCEAFTVNFGHVVLPRAALAHVPPSLRMLGVSPQSKLNCEVLHEELAFEVRWAVAEDSVVLQLVAKLEDGEYMSFGISGDRQHSRMVGGDVVAAWVDKGSLKGEAVDYYLDAKSQCAGVRGSCPDERLAEKTNSVKLMNSVLANGYSIVTYQRTLRAADELDLPVLTNQSQPVIWAIGPLNSRNEVSYHHHFTKGDKFIEFGRPPAWNCPRSEGEEEHHPQPPRKELQREPVREQALVIKPNPVPTPKPVPKSEPWEIPAIQCYEPPDGVFYAQMGPTGGKQGYSAITGHVGWGISWYINGLLIPEINVVRGKKYTFVVEGGSNPDVPARYHPFYITNDPVGGYFHKSDAEKKGVEIYAGVRRARNGELQPAGVGRLCNWTPDAAGPEADEYPSFGAYQRSLTLVCEEGSPGVVTWTPDRDTPDTVYYQCYTHRHLGWKINVLDECDEVEGEESRVIEKIALPDDLQSEESIQVHTRLSSDNIIDPRKKVGKIINTKTNYDNFSSNSGLTGEVFSQDRNQLYAKDQEFELPISNLQIKDVIQTVENIESKMKDEMKHSASSMKPLGQYQVHEDVKESFTHEQPIREDDEYTVETGKVPESYFLPPNQKPLTLQTVLRPNGPKPSGNMRPPFRRPVPPEIKLRRPPPMFQKNNNGYPLPMPNHQNHHGPHAMQKKQQKYPNNRLQPNMNMNRPAMGNSPPMKPMPPLHTKTQFNQGPQKYHGPKMTSPVQSIILGKPIPGNIQMPLPTKSQTLSLGQTDIIANQVVKSQITLPSGITNGGQSSYDTPQPSFDTIIQHSFDSIAQHNSPQSYLKPGQVGQIILGKPMDNPIPLDQQMIQNKPQIIKAPPTPPPQYFPSTTLRIKLSNEYQQYNEIKSSDFIGETQETSTLHPAINTGFKPDSIVVESGFKPIIREPLMAAEDRITDVGYETNSNRREDTDVEEDYEESPQVITNHAFPSDRITQSFEPMFIPSPEDHMLPTIPTNDKTKEVFPKNHAKVDRPHPVYVKTESELNALFSKKNMEKDVPDMMMESDRVSPHYLPPDPKLPKEHSQKISNEPTFTTYDGKTVSAATLTSVPEVNKTMTKLFSSKLPANTALLLRTPQFGPFKGEIPPPVDDSIAKDSAKLPDIRTTKLKLVNVNTPVKADLDELKADGSKIHEVTEKLETEEEEYEDEEDEEEDTKRRRKRESKTTQFDKGEVEPVHTNGHSLAKSQINYEEVNSAAPVRNQRLFWTTQIVLLTLLIKVF